MVKFYVMRILSGKTDLKDVHSALRPAVEEELIRLGRTDLLMETDRLQFSV